MPRVQTYQPNQVRQSAVQVPAQQRTRIDSRGAFGEGVAGGGLNLAQSLVNISEDISLNEDRSAATNAFNAARDAVRVDHLENLYSKQSSDLFPNGIKTQDVYKNTQDSVQKISQQFNKNLVNERQRTYFNELWGSFSNSELNSASRHIATQHRAYIKQTRDDHVASMDSSVGQLASGVEQNWRAYPNALKEVESQLNQAFNVVGVSSDVIETKKQSYQDYIHSAVIRGWFAEHPDPVRASMILSGGEFQDTKIENIWNALDPNQRKAIRTDLISQSQKLIKMQNDQRELRKEAEQIRIDQDIGNFYAADDLGTRIDIYTKYSNDPRISLSIRQDMRENIAGGNVTDDWEEGLLDLEDSIRNGDITTISEAEAYRYDGKKPGTAETYRTRIYPLIESVQDEVFTDAFNAGIAALGIANTAAETNPVLRARAARFKSDFLRWKNSPEGKDGDAFAASDAIIQKIKSDIKVDPATMSMLRQLKKRYEDALATNNMTEAMAARQSLDGMTGLLAISIEDIK